MEIDRNSGKKVKCQNEKKEKISITVTSTAPSICCTTRSGMLSSTALFFTQIRKLSSAAENGVVFSVDGVPLTAASIALEIPELLIAVDVPLLLDAASLAEDTFVFSATFNSASSGTSDDITFRYFVLL